MAIDAVRRHVFVIGGYPGPMGDLWMLDLNDTPPTWHHLADALSGPGNRYGSTLIYDSSRHRLLLMGGSNATGSQYFSDVWQYPIMNPTGWQLLSTIGVGPGEIAFHGAVYDSLRDRMVIVGGQTRLAYLDAVWALTLSGSVQWTRLATTGPSPGARSRAAVVYDPILDRIVRYGGRFSADTYGDVWSLPLTAGGEWGQLLPAGSVAGSRAGVAAAFDIQSRSMVIYGGEPFAGACTLDLSGPPVWRSESTPSLPGPRHDATMIWDSLNDRMLLFGGVDTGWRSDVWAWSLSYRSWSEQFTIGTPEHPDDRADHAAAIRASTGQMWMIGGYGDNNSTGSSDVWRMDLSASPTWSRIHPQGTAPGRYGHVMVLDEPANRLLVFGGVGFESNDLWSITLDDPSAWTLLSPPGSAPPAEEERGSAYDPIRHRMIVTGYSETGGWDVWALPLDGVSPWVEITAMVPSPRVAVWGNSTIYDAVGDQLVLLGGDPESQVWGLSLGETPAWHLIYSGPGPSVRGEHGVTFDTRRRRILLSGGYGPGIDLADLWEFTLGGTASWRLLSPTGPTPMPRAFQSVSYDSTFDRMVMFGGHNGAYLADTWFLEFDQPTAALVSVENAICSADSARIIWQMAEPRICAVERSEGSAVWRRISRALPDGFDRITFLDSGLQPNREYRYRLGWQEGGRTLSGGEISIRTASRSSLSILGLAPCPATDKVILSYTTPDNVPLTVEVFDVQGRRVLAQSSEARLGSHRMTLGVHDLRAGVYQIVVGNQGSTRSARFVVVR